jgi:hypothetical protein
MIINGGSRCNGRFFAKHLTNGDENERVTLCELRNLAADNVAGALQEMEAVASGTLCKNYFYHANINPQHTEQLTPQQWDLAVGVLEKNLNLGGHARFVVEHRKKGRTHRHVIWSRIDVSTMRAVNMTDDYAKHQATARELEHEFNLERVQSVFGRTRLSGPRPARRPKTWESFRGQKSGIGPEAMKRTITQLYRSCTTGREFAALLNKHGYKLLRGDRCDFCIVDQMGHIHSLSRRIDGVSAATIKAFIGQVDIDRYPVAHSSNCRTPDS